MAENENVFSRPVEVAIGLAFLGAAFVLFIISLVFTTGPTSVVLLVLAGVSLVVCLYFLSGGGDQWFKAPPPPGATAPPPELPATPPLPSMRPAGSTGANVCHVCGFSAPAGLRRCTRCGAALG